jgi:hypothetical protein
VVYNGIYCKCICLSCSVKVGMKLLNIDTPVTRNFIPQILLNVQDFYFHNEVMLESLSPLKIHLPRPAAPESALPASLSRWGPHLQDALSARLPLWQSHDEVWPCDSHKCPSSMVTRQGFSCSTFSDQSVLSPGSGTCSQAPPARHS